MAKISVYTDGGSRGNPGEAALGVYIENENGEEVISIGKRLGVATNNVAEYAAILEAFLYLILNKEKYEKGTEIYFFMDSLLAYSQIMGLYKIKNEKLKLMLFDIKNKQKSLGLPVYYKHIRREHNKKADLMVNLALDNRL